MKLTAENVQRVLDESLFPDPTPDQGEAYREDCIKRGKIIKGIVRSFCFAPDRIEAKRADIEDMLRQLPDEFRSDKGGGWSFLNACMDRDGVQWGEHRDMEALFALGIGIGAARELMPNMRDVLPGGMPYYSVLSQPEAAKR